ncbi:MAG TPA: hypothetical protein VKA49_13300 [Flavitalea sp.]|nr:hypothetical protein [Flavitalea sp.]
MNPGIRKHFDNLRIRNAEERYSAFQSILKLTQQPVDWACEVWDDGSRLN